jgi:hypothetical protein
MKRLFLLIIGLYSFWVVLCSEPVLANTVSGEELLAICRSQQDSDLEKCDSYVQGVIDYHILTQSLGTAPTIDFCVPDDIDTTMLRSMVVRYLTKNQHHKTFIAAPAIALALYESYPCR